MNNNKIDRLNGEIRDRKKVQTSLRRIYTTLIDGMRMYYNFTKKYVRLKDKTPAEVAKIKVDGLSK